jgi:hypothetical protein
MEAAAGSIPLVNFYYAVDQRYLNELSVDKKSLHMLVTPMSGQCL